MEDNNKLIFYVFGFIVFCLLIYFLINNKGSQFNNVLDGNINEATPRVLPKLFPDLKDNNSTTNIIGIPTKIDSLGNPTIEQHIPLLKPDVPEEIGFPLYGKGVSMDPLDSNVFNAEKTPGDLHVNYSQNDSVGESTYSDEFGSRIIKIKSSGNQNNFIGLDESTKKYQAGAYNKQNIQSGYTLINGSNSINYSSEFIPTQNLKLETSPGHSTVTENCESTYPHTINNNGICLTEGDIPYNSIVNGKVNPRLVSRWESYTGNYNPNDIIKQQSSLFPVI
jgi:hypothetical protein